MGFNYKWLGRREEAADRIEGNLIVGVGCIVVCAIGLACIGIDKAAKKIRGADESPKPHTPDDGL